MKWYLGFAAVCSSAVPKAFSKKRETTGGIQELMKTTPNEMVAMNNKSWYEELGEGVVLEASTARVHVCVYVHVCQYMQSAQCLTHVYS